MTDTPTPPSRMIDARGHRCPTPSLKLRRALDESVSGDIVALWADDPMAKIDIPHFVSKSGDEVVFSDLSGPYFIFWIRKAYRNSTA
jgi:tRNA 2-thiouridine synthesizing protein A